MATPGDMPEHNFGESGLGRNGKPLGPSSGGGPARRARQDSPDDICYAMLQTATAEADGYDMVAQCGHKRSEH